MEIQTQETGLSLFDKGNFEQLCIIADRLAHSSLIPATLQGKSEQETAANCLLVVEQSQRWGLSPFAAMQCASVVHGKLMWEGKLVAAVLDASLGVNLKYTYSGTGENMAVEVSGMLPSESEPRTISGTVKAWKTTGNGSPWKPENYERQLAYRGARDWARRHAPAAMLGVVTDDEELTKPGVRNVTPIREAVIDHTAVIETKPEEVKPAAKAKPKAKAKPEPEGTAGEVTIDDYKVKEGETDGKPWTRHEIKITTASKGNQITVTTFSNTIGGLAGFNVGAKAMATIKRTDDGFTLTALEILGE